MNHIKSNILCNT